MTATTQDGVDLLALSGGGFKAMAADAGLFAGVMKARGIDVATLLHDDLAISANSGSTWFTNLLGYSESFVTSLNDYQHLFGTDATTDMTVGGADGFFGVMGEAYRGYLNEFLDAGFQNVLDELAADITNIGSVGELTDFLAQAPRNFGRLLIAGLYDSGTALVEVLDNQLSGAPGYSALRSDLSDMFASYDLKSVLGVASVALLDGIDWNRFMQRTVFAPDQVGQLLAATNFYDGQNRTTALASQSLIYELAISADEATVAPEGASLGSDIVKVSVTNDEAKYGSWPQATYNFLPASATSRGNTTDAPAPWLPNIPSGDLQVNYDSTGLFNDESRTFSDLDFSGLSAFLASSISSSAAALAGSYGVMSDWNSVLGAFINILDTYSSSQVLGKVSDILLDYTKGLAPLVQATQSQPGSWTAGDPIYVGSDLSDPIDTVSNEGAANAGYLRMADGGYFDNSSVTSGLSYLEANQDSWVANDGKSDFDITLFVFSGIGEEVSSTLKDRGFDNIGNVTQRLFTGGKQQEFGVLADVSHPNSAVFDSTRTSGMGSPIWSYAAPADTPASGAGFEIKAYTMGVETVPNNTMNIGGGYQGTVHLWNVISKTGPVPLNTLFGAVPVFGLWSDYEVMYNQIIDSLQTGTNGITGAGLLATQLGVNAAPTDIMLSGPGIAENAAVGAVVGELSTADADASDTATYTLVAGDGSADNPLFTIDGSRLKAAATFDFETKNSYVVRIRAVDSGGLSTEKSFTIAVTNAKEAPSLWLPSTFTVVEDTPTALGFPAPMLGTSDAPATKRVTVVLQVSSGEIDSASTIGVAVGGSGARRTFTGSIAAVNQFFADAGGRVRYRPAASVTAPATLRVTVAEATLQGVLRRDATSVVNVTPVNDAPVVHAPAAIRVVEDVRGAISWTSIGAPFADVDSPNLTVTLAVRDGTIDAQTAGGVTVGGSGTARTFAGSPAALNAYFRSVGQIGYTTALDSTATRLLFTTVTDGLAYATATTRIRVTPIDDAPTIGETTALTGAVAGMPFVITHAMLVSASGARDSERSPLQFRTQGIQAGALQKWEGYRWGAAIVGSSAQLVVRPGERIRWLPPANAAGTIPAFTIRVVAGGLTSAIASQVSVDVAS